MAKRANSNIAIYASALILMMAILGYVLTGGMIFGVGEPAVVDEIGDTCYNGFPQEKRAGLKGQLSNDQSVVFDVGGSEEMRGNSDAEVNKAAIECTKILWLEYFKTKDGDNSKNSATNLIAVERPIPLGQVAQQWEGSDFIINLNRPDTKEGDEIINNLRFPAFFGSKQNAMTEWCQAYSACAQCSPISGG